jgi:hypothetical protein
VIAMSDNPTAREDRIRLRAYQIWQDAGCPEGAAQEHWRLAELQEAEDAEIDEASDDSFPASDPPSHTVTLGPE